MAEEKPLITKPTSGDLVRVRRGLVDSVDLYEIKDSELDILENGSPTDLRLNFSIFLLSLAFSGLCTLLTATFSNPKIENIFTLTTICSTIGGIYLLLSWHRNRASLTAVCKRIRERIPPEIILTAKDSNIQQGIVVEHQIPKG